MCSGTGGYRAKEVTEDIYLMCDWNIKEYDSVYTNMVSRLSAKENSEINLPYSIVKVKGYFTDWPKLQRATEIILQTPLEPYIHYKFRIASEPIDENNIIQGIFFVCILKRMG